VIGKGGQGTVYRLDEETIVKLYDPGYSLDAINSERNIAKAALKAGIPTAISFGTVKAGDSYGVIFEMMNSGTLSAAMKKDPENLPKYVKMYYDMFQEIHQIEDKDESFPKIKTCLHEQADRMGRWLGSDEIGILHELTDALKDSNTIIHGDYHPGNLMLHNDELLIIDVPNIRSGNPLYDLYTVFRDMVSCPQSTPFMCEISQGMSPEMCTQVGQMFFSMYCKSQDPQVIGDFLKKLGLVYSFFLTLFLGEENLHSETEKAAPRIIEGAFKGAVLPNVEALKMMLANM
jgi:uncharacterized protein (TIGR02172 family)